MVAAALLTVGGGGRAGSRSRSRSNRNPHSNRRRRRRRPTSNHRVAAAGSLLLLLLSLGAGAYIFVIHRSLGILQRAATAVDDNNSAAAAAAAAAKDDDDDDDESSNNNNKLLMISAPPPPIIKKKQRATDPPFEERRRRRRQREYYDDEPSAPVVVSFAQLLDDESGSGSGSSNATTATATEALPRWMTDYFAWHAQQLRTLTADNWKTKSKSKSSQAEQHNHRFLLARCLESDRACGGVSDRLKSLPTLLLLAARSRRILLFEWTRPAPLQSFLVPNHVIATADTDTDTGGDGIGVGVGINWTRPSFVPVRGRGTRLYTKLATLIKATANNSTTSSTVPVLCARIQDQHGGSDYYNRHPWNSNDNVNNGSNNSSNDEPPRRAFRQVFRRVFFAVFAPSPRVRARYRREARQLRWAMMRVSHNNNYSTSSTNDSTKDNNQPPDWQYKAAHLRAYYGNSPVPPAQVEAVAVNAVNCASQLSQHPASTTATEEEEEEGDDDDDIPVLFISDSALALQAVERHARTWNLPVFTTLPFRQRQQQDQDDRRVPAAAAAAVEPLHLDKADSRSADDYVDIFVDLLHLANARCVSHGPGGFGRLGVLLSRDPACFQKYVDQSRYVECSGRWKST